MYKIYEENPDNKIKKNYINTEIFHVLAQKIQCWLQIQFEKVTHEVKQSRGSRKLFVIIKS